MRETDLYLPVKRLLESQGYVVKGEVDNCDVVASRPGEPPVIVELKVTLNLHVVLQAVARTSVSPSVYVGVPWNCGVLKRHRRDVLKLFRMLGMGLLSVDPRRAHGAAEVLLDPGEYRPRRSKERRGRLLREFELRVGDTTPGGTDRRRGILTAYRQRALRLARYLKQNGPTRAADVAGALGEPEARMIMYRNVYGWFDRPADGTYSLSPRGKREIRMWPGARSSTSDSP